MKIRTLIKVLLIITGASSIIGSVTDYSELELMAKPMTVPLFFMLYWFNVKKLNWLFLAVLFLCFLGDVFLLIELDNSFLYVLICYTVCYLILFYFIFKDKWVLELQYNNRDVVSISLLFLVWTLIVYYIYMAIEPNLGDLKTPAVIYLLLLYVLLFSAICQYINQRSQQSLWFMIAIINFVISDACFAINKFYLESIELQFLNALYQLLAVFFLVKFMISSPISLKIRA